MDSLRKLKRHLRRGQVYCRSDLERWSNAVDRHLKQLVVDGTLQKMPQGVYYYPKETVFGAAPPDEANLVRTFLKDDEFLITSPNSYNALEIGTTQLYNKRVVYNHKRHGEFELKGGTSLSKGYQIIQRFSEDIHIHIKAPAHLGVNENRRNDKSKAIQSRRDFYNWLADNISIDGITKINPEPSIFPIKF